MKKLDVNVVTPGEMHVLHFRTHGHQETDRLAIVVVNDSPDPVRYVWKFTHKDIEKAELYAPFEEVRTVKQGDVLEIKGDGLQILVEDGIIRKSHVGL